MTLKTSNHLDLSQLLLLLPVPNRQDVVVGVVHGAEERAAVLTGKSSELEIHGGLHVRGCVCNVTEPENLQPLVISLNLYFTRKVLLILKTSLPKSVLVKRQRNSKSRFSYRLGERHAGDRPVKHPCPDDVQRVETHRVPNADVRSQKLNGVVDKHRLCIRYATKIQTFETEKMWEALFPHYLSIFRGSSHLASCYGDHVRMYT